MQISIEHQGKLYRCDTSKGASIAITLDFAGPQPNHFGTAKAKQEVLKLGTFTGDTEVGGSCNVMSLSMIPHCNGTHTETVSHIVNEDIWIGHVSIDPLIVAMLGTVRPAQVPQLSIKEKKESYRPALADDDTVITRGMLERTFKLERLKKINPTALVLRTLPNEDAKRSRAYGEDFQPPFLTIEAMQWIVETGINHLLVDTPSVDRMYDDGLLTNHHIFWNVTETQHGISPDSRQDKTITEMVFVPDELSDGLYLLNLQVPAFASDAAPSRPILYPASTS